MEKQNHKKTTHSKERDQNRLTTAPVRQRPNNFELPMIRGKNYIGRQPMVASRDIKRNTTRRQDVFKVQHDFHESNKRPQTSKGSRNCNKHESEYYEDDGDDLIVTSMQERIQNFKKINQKINFQQPSAKNL